MSHTQDGTDGPSHIEQTGIASTTEISTTLTDIPSPSVTNTASDDIALQSKLIQSSKLGSVSVQGTPGNKTTLISRESNTEDHEEDQYYLSGLFNIETSPAYKSLEALKGKKEVQESQIEHFKQSFLRMHGFLIRFNEYEKNIAKKLKASVKEVTMQKLERDRAVSKQFSGNAEIGELKRELLKAQNEVDLAFERESKLQKETDELSKQKQDLVHDIEEIRRHKADMLEPQLITATKDLKMDIHQRRHQVENLQKDMEEKQSTYEVVAIERDRLEKEREKFVISLAKATETPLKIQKQVDVLKDAIQSLGGENSKQLTLTSQLDKELERLAKKKHDLENMRMGQAADYEERRGLIHAMERQVDDIFKEHELAKEQLTFQKAERVRLDLSAKKTIHDIKREHDTVLRVIREKDTQLKLHRRLETTVNNIKMSTPSIRKQAEDYRRQLEFAKADEKFYHKENTRLRKLIDVATYDFLMQEKVETNEMEELQEQVAANKRLESELESASNEYLAAVRAVDEIKMEKDIRAREVVRIQAKTRAIKGDTAAKEISIMDASKRAIEAAGRLKDFGALYELVKNERNKYLNHIQSSTQRAAEMKEKIKILSNEIEILRHEIYNKDRELSKRKQENSAAYAGRDSLKNEANKLMMQYRDRRDQIDQHLASLESLNTHINSAEQEMLAIKLRYEQLIKERNMVGVHLLDRNDELCIIYERLNVQVEIMSKGELGLREREDEIRKLALIATELKRKIDLLKRDEPLVGVYQIEIEKLERERDKLRKYVIDLSREMENPDDPKRCRNLNGADPTPIELLKKIERLEDMLATREEKLLEKDLIMEEIATLTNRLKKQTLDGKQETYQVTRKLNDLTKRIKHVTRTMMSKVSELAMYQSHAMNLYQEKSEKEALVEEAVMRLEKGDIPTEQIERDFIRMEKTRMRKESKQRAIKERNLREQVGRLVDVDDDDFYMYGKVRTMAEPRPNAYIPDATGLGTLPIPKPYGAHAPFKPQEPGTQIRHYRKPVEKPIELLSEFRRFSYCKFVGRCRMLSVLEAHKSSLSRPSSSVSQQVGMHFADGASILYVPTAAGAQGKRAIEEFVKNVGRQSHIIENEQILSRMVGDQSVVEESIVRLIHTDPIDWLLPGVRPTKKQIVFPMVTILSFDETGKIVSKRVYWDQASVLRQAGVLPRSLYCKANASEVQLPVLDGSIVNSLQDSILDSNVLLRVETSAGLSNAQRDAMENKPATPVKGRTAAQGMYPQGEELPIRASNNRQKSDVFGLEPDTAASSYAASRRSSAMSSVFPEETKNVARPSTRVLQPSGGHSSNIFGDDQPIRSAYSSQATAQANADMVRQFAESSLDDVAEETSSNASSQTTHSIGGRRAYAGKTNESQFSFGDDSSTVGQRHATNSTHGMGRRVYGDTNKSQFSFGSDVNALPDSPNHHHNTLHTGRKINSASNQSQFSFGSETPETVKHAAAQSARSSVASIPRSTNPFEDQPLPNAAFRSGRRDPNAMSNEHLNGTRPSSRVLKAPGGGSSITFG
ncbi:hypothetical protein BDV3_003585 [Batrachochytrium dendrobatidis]